MHTYVSVQGVTPLLFLHIKSENNVRHVCIPSALSLNNSQMEDMTPVYHWQSRLLCGSSSVQEIVWLYFPDQR